MAWVLLLLENQGQDKRVESILVPCLDAGSNPAISTKKIVLYIQACLRVKNCFFCTGCCRQTEGITKKSRYITVLYIQVCLRVKNCFFCTGCRRQTGGITKKSRYITVLYIQACLRVKSFFLYRMPSADWRDYEEIPLSPQKVFSSFKYD